MRNNEKNIKNGMMNGEMRMMDEWWKIGKLGIQEIE